LTKALGTGLLATAVKRSEPAAVRGSGWLAKPYDEAVASMTRLNREAATVALDLGATAATDVTGFGLLGHLHKLALASGLAAEVQWSAVPLLAGALELLEAGYVPGGTGRNLDYVRPFVDIPDGVPADLLADPQTSGGLLVACAPEAADEAVARLRSSGHAAAVVGYTTTGQPGRVVVR
jgi:selenide,water dikinase